MRCRLSILSAFFFLFFLSVVCLSGIFKWPTSELEEAEIVCVDDTDEPKLLPPIRNTSVSTSHAQTEIQPQSVPDLMDAPLAIIPQRIVMVVTSGHTGQQAVTISNQSKHLQSLQICIESPEEHWLHFQPTTLSIMPGEIEKLTVSCETHGLEPGDYTATLKIVSELEEVTLSVELSVHPRDIGKPPLRGLGAPNRPTKTVQPTDNFATLEGEESAGDAQETEADESSNDDEIVFEAEDAVFMTPTFVVLENSSASNSEYITPLNGAGNFSGQAGYRFQIQKAGTYKVIGRVLAPSEEDDSFYVRMDYGRRYFWDLPAGSEWTWVPVASGWRDAEVNFELEAGEHTLRIESREDGTMLDILVISRVSD